MTGYGPKGLSHTSNFETPRELIFQRIRAAGEIARVDIARDLNLSPATVTTLTAGLLSAGLVEETSTPRPAEQGRGRPRVALRLRADAHYVAGLKLGDRLLTMTILDFQGRQLAEASLPSPKLCHDVEDLCDLVERCIQIGLSKAGLTMMDLSAIGVGVPGFVDAERGMVHWSPVITKRTMPLQAMLEARLLRPVFIDNDANLVALAELWFGVGRTMRDFLVVTIEQGVGLGIVLNNRLYRGTRGRGAEFGHMKVQPEGALCRCGQRGCLEAYVADYALLREAETALPHAPSNPQDRLEVLFAEAKAGNLAARSIFRRAGRLFSIGLANLVNIFDPELVILSGEQMRYDYLYSEEVGRQMEENTLDLDDTSVELRVHKWEDLLWAKGAAALALEGLTSRIMAGTMEDA